LVSRALFDLWSRDLISEVFPDTPCTHFLKSECDPLVPLPSPTEYLSTQPGPVYLRSRSRDPLQTAYSPRPNNRSHPCATTKPPSASPGVLFPSAYVSTRSPLNPGLPHPARSAREVSHLLSGLLLPAPPGFISPRNAPGIHPSELSPPREPCASRRPYPPAVYSCTLIHG